MTDQYDEFGGPASRHNRATEDGIELDRWNRYVLPDPLTGEPRAWTRASTVAKTLPDTYHLGLWKQRSVAVGLSKRPDLLALVASVDDPSGDAGKAILNGVCERALEAAGGTARRDLGTALHSFTARHDRGLATAAPPHLAPDMAAYAGLLREQGLIALPAFAERVVCVPEWGVAGRLDRVVSCFDRLLRVADVKTGDRADEFGDLEFVVQQGIYVRGLAYGTYNPTHKAWEPFPYADRLGVDVALIIHLPVGQPERAAVYAFDISSAATHIERALSARESRRAKNLRATWADYAGYLRTRVEVTTLDSPEPQYLPTTVPDPYPAPDLDGPEPTVEVIHDSNWYREVDLSVPRQMVAREADDPTDPYRDVLEIASRCVTGELRAGAPPTLFDLLRAAESVDQLSALWQVLYPAGLWSTDVHERAVTRERELEKS